MKRSWSVRNISRNENRHFSPRIDVYKRQALYHGALVNPVERNHALLVASLRVFRGSSLMDSGAHEDMKLSLIHI